MSEEVKYPDRLQMRMKPEEYDMLYAVMHHYYIMSGGNSEYETRSEFIKWLVRKEYNRINLTKSQLSLKRRLQYKQKKGIELTQEELDFINNRRHTLSDLLPNIEEIEKEKEIKKNIKKNTQNTVKELTDKQLLNSMFRTVKKTIKGGKKK